MVKTRMSDITKDLFSGVELETSVKRRGDNVILSFSKDKLIRIDGQSIPMNKAFNLYVRGVLGTSNIEIAKNIIAFSKNFNTLKQKIAELETENQKLKEELAKLKQQLAKRK